MPHIAIGTQKLHYLQFGTGSNILLAFHGYGEHAGTFSVFEPHLGNAYTILSFDIPFHGLTQWQGSEPLTEDALTQLALQVMQQFGVAKVSLMGYSIGGRVCLSMVHAIPQSIHRVLLMASDGLVINRYYWFFNRVAVGRFLFTRFLNSGSLAFRVAALCRRLRLIREGQFRLAQSVLQTPERRLQLLHAWPCLRFLVTPPAVLKEVINKHQLPVHIFMGATDRILPPSLGKQFAAGVPTVHLQVVARGHRIFDAANAAQLAAPLLSS
jgi:pimeloyl-ACP methyl ester carboxylesterase